MGLSKKYLEKRECREGEVKKREVSKFKFRSLVQRSTNFCHRRPNIVNILGFAGYMISVTTPQLSHYSVKAAVDNVYTNRAAVFE